MQAASEPLPCPVEACAIPVSEIRPARFRLQVEFRVLPQPAGNTGYVHGPVLYPQAFEQALHFIEVREVAGVRHGRYGNIKSRLTRGPHGLHRTREHPVSPERVVGLFKAVNAHLYLLNVQSFEVRLVKRQAVRKQNFPEHKILKHFVHRIELCVKERFAARDQDPKPLHLFELPQNVPDLL